MKTCPTCQGSYPNNYAVCPADGTPLQEAGTWADGSVLRGKYRLLAKVGHGGMGSVYKALHLAFDELRAIKVIAPELLSDELFVKRFKHEAVITRRLQHPNAVRVDDIDEAEDGRPFIVMEFIDGKSLKKLIREEGPLDVPRVLRIVKQAARALEAANGLGMIHRDIKPDNIALVASPDGETVKVLDFGIAKLKEARTEGDANLTLTGAGVVIGTPQYMSPEQAMGKRGDELDGRADLYSLGVVMYQMLTADLPFKADTTMEMLLAHMQKAPTPIATAHPELQVPANVASLTLRLLEKDRERRPASARVLIQEIEKLERELANPQGTVFVPMPPQPPPVRPEPPKPGPPPPLRPEPRKPAPPPVLRPQPPVKPPSQPRESRWGMWVALAVLAVGVGGMVLWYATRQTVEPPTATLTADPATVEKGQSVMLRWSSQNATDLDLEPGVGKVQAEGSTSVTPQDSMKYTLTATGPGGTKSSQADVSVTILPTSPPSGPHSGPPTGPPTSRPRVPARVTATLAATPTTVENGSPVTLRWSSQNAASLDLEPKVGRVSRQGSQSVTPQQTTTYTLTAVGPDGTQVQEETAVTVTKPQVSIDLKKVKGALSLGQFHLKRGEYDDAIASFREGLKLDPSNPELRKILGETIKACESERATLHEPFKCGAN